MTRTLFPLLAMAQGLAGCGGFASPSAVPPPTPLAVFTDRATGYTTTDVRDVHEQIVRFNAAGELIWTADESRFPGYLADGHVVTAHPICQGCYFLIRFGTKDGTERAYLTWSGEESDGEPATVLDVEIVAGRLVVTNTSVSVPKQ